jgi:hypothetical protein
VHSVTSSGSPWQLRVGDVVGSEVAGAVVGNTDGPKVGRADVGLNQLGISKVLYHFSRQEL